MEPTKKDNIQKIKQQSQLLTNSPASLPQEIKILNIVIKPRITYAYYVVPFSKPYMRILDQIIRKSTKEICNIPKNTTNILTHLPNENFSIDHY